MITLKNNILSIYCDCGNEILSLEPIGDKLNIQIYNSNKDDIKNIIIDKIYKHKKTHRFGCIIPSFEINELIDYIKQLKFSESETTDNLLVPKLIIEYSNSDKSYRVGIDTLNKTSYNKERFEKYIHKLEKFIGYIDNKYSVDKIDNYIESISEDLI